MLQVLADTCTGRDMYKRGSPHQWCPRLLAGADLRVELCDRSIPGVMITENKKLDVLTACM